MGFCWPQTPPPIPATQEGLARGFPNHELKKQQATSVASHRVVRAVLSWLRCALPRESSPSRCLQLRRGSEPCSRVDPLG